MRESAVAGLGGLFILGAMGAAVWSVVPAESQIVDIPVSSAPTVKVEVPKTTVGLYMVGTDIGPGTYRYMVDNWHGGSWERLTCLTPPEVPECVAERSATTTSSVGGYVTVRPGDVALRVFGITLLREPK